MDELFEVLEGVADDGRPQVIASSLKNGWRTVRFGDVVRNVEPSPSVDPETAGIDRIIGLEHLDPENLHIRRVGHAGSRHVIFAQVRTEGQTVFGKRRAYQRKVAFAEFEGLCSGDILTFEPKDPEVLLPELLPFICQTRCLLRPRARHISAGSLSPRTSWKALQDYEFPLPPIEEQKRIAEILWAADEAVEGYLRAEERLSSLRNRFFRAFLRRNATVRVPCSKLFELPPRNGYSPKTNASGRGAPTLSIGAVRDGTVNPNGNTKYAEISSTDLDKYRLEPGDILIVRGNGNRSLCGRAGIVADIPGDCFYPDLLIRIKFDEKKILPAFAVEQWNEPTTHKHLLAYAKSTNGIWKVNGKDLRQHKLDVPSLDAQVLIVQRLDDFRKQQDEISRHVDRTHQFESRLLNSLTQGVAHV